MKTTPSALKVVILGGAQVGKSALVVRFLTKRFIGEYSSGCDCIYQTMSTFGDAVLRVDVIDCSSQSDLTKNKDLKTADAVVVVYSIIDRDSFKSAHSILDYVHNNVHYAIPILVLGNKIDLEHRRQVTRDDTFVMTQQYQCRHLEVSAAESYVAVNKPMHQLLQEGFEKRRSRVGPVKRRRSLFENVSRRLGNVFRRRSLEDLLPKKKLPRISENMNRRSV